MKKILFIVFTVLIACNQPQQDVTEVDLIVTSQMKSELFLPEEEGLSMFYDICAKNEQLYCLDFHNDTVLKVYNNEIPPTLVGYTLRGEGPEELVFPLFEATLPNMEKQNRVLDLSSWSLKEMVGDGGRIKAQKIKNLPAIPAMRNYNETAEAIYGNETEYKEGAFFRYDKKEKSLQNASECLKDEEIPSIYTSEERASLRSNQVVVNEQENVVCVALLYVNLLCWYDLDGNLKQRVLLGDDWVFPMRDNKYLDFPNARKQIVSMSGTEKHLYCLYNGNIAEEEGSLILQFDWKGKLKEVLKPGVSLEKITVSPDGGYIYGTHITENGGSDVYRMSF